LNNQYEPQGTAIRFALVVRRISILQALTTNPPEEAWLTMEDIATSQQLKTEKTETGLLTKTWTLSQSTDHLRRADELPKLGGAQQQADDAQHDARIAITKGLYINT